MLKVMMSMSVVLAAGAAYASAPAAPLAQTNERAGQATCKVSPDRTIMKCTYVGKDSYGNSIY